MVMPLSFLILKNMQNKIFELIAKLAFEFSPDRVTAIAKEINDLNNLREIDSIKSAWGKASNSNFYSTFIEETKNNAINMTSNELAIALKTAMITASYAKETMGKQEVIWTGPHNFEIHLRNTETALNYIINKANNRIFITSYAVYMPEAILESLIRAEERKVRIEFLLEASVEHGGVMEYDSVAFLRKYLQDAIFYEWVSENKSNKSSVHAKCAIADMTNAIVTSANLTAKAMDDNMELGILLEGGPIPNRIQCLFDNMLEENIIRRIK